MKSVWRYWIFFYGICSHIFKSHGRLPLLFFSEGERDEIWIFDLSSNGWGCSTEPNQTVVLVMCIVNSWTCICHWVGTLEDLILQRFVFFCSISNVERLLENSPPFTDFEVLYFLWTSKNLYHPIRILKKNRAHISNLRDAFTLPSVSLSLSMQYLAALSDIEYDEHKKQKQQYKNLLSYN